MAVNDDAHDNINNGERKRDLCQLVCIRGEVP